MNSAFEFLDYRHFLSLRAQESWGEITRMAKAAHCQRSYLSRAVKGEVLLTPDHMHALCEYWKLPDEERDFLMLLLEKERASSATYRKHLEERIQQKLLDQENLTKRLETPSLEIASREMQYYSAWHWAAIHLSVSVASLQTESALSQALQIRLPLVRKTLHQLAEWGLVKRQGSRWLHASGNLHLPKHSPLISQHHRQWREKAADDSLLPESSGLHYTQLQAMDESAFRDIKRILLKSVDQTLAVADKSGSERLVAVTIDAFEI